VVLGLDENDGLDEIDIRSHDSDREIGKSTARHVAHTI
jgi:hypothetical protein